MMTGSARFGNVRAWLPVHVTTVTLCHRSAAELRLLPERSPRREGTGERCLKGQGASMAQQGMAQQANTGRVALGGAGVQAGIAPEIAVRLVGALLALGVAAVHVTDQGGVSAFASPSWIGWSYR